jgi:hypothetical protein
MSTPFTDINELFLTVIQDYRLNLLYNQSETDFNDYLEGFLILAIPEFDNCVKSLDYDNVNKCFYESLDIKEKSILSKLMVLKWWEREINNTTQINLHLNDREFKHYAEGENLKQKSERANQLREIVKQDMVDYGFKHVDWKAWANGDFGI